MTNKIILEAETKLEDNKLREEVYLFIRQIEKKVERINTRTKLHTIDINQLKWNTKQK